MRQDDQLKQQLHELSAVINETYGARLIGVFGSRASGEDHPESDVDLLVKFNESATLFDYIDLCEFLEEELDQPVDLVTEDSIRDEMRDAIYSSLVRL